MGKFNDELHTALANISNKTFGKGLTAGETLKNLNTAYIPVCVTTFSAKDSVSSEAVTGFALIVRNGAGEFVFPKTEGGLIFDLPAGTYTYTISKTGYTTQTDVELTIATSDVTTGTKAVSVSLVAAEE